MFLSRNYILCFFWEISVALLLNYGELCVWKSNGTLLNKIENPDTGCTSVCFSKEKENILYASFDEKIKVYDFKNLSTPSEWFEVNQEEINQSADADRLWTSGGLNIYAPPSAFTFCSSCILNWFTHFGREKSQWINLQSRPPVIISHGFLGRKQAVEQIFVCFNRKVLNTNLFQVEMTVVYVCGI
jgi:WD40 repeat protein